MEQKNFILAIALSVAFLFIWSWVVVPKFTPKPLPTPPDQTSPNATVANQPAELAPNSAASQATASGADLVLSDDRNEITLTPLGGAIKSWRVKVKGQVIDLVNRPDLPALET